MILTSMLFMVRLSVKAGKSPVNLLQEKDFGQPVRQGHGRKGEPEVGLFLQGILQPIGATQDESHFFEAGAAPSFQGMSKGFRRKYLPPLVHRHGKNARADFPPDSFSFLLKNVLFLPPGRNFFLGDNNQVEGRIPSDSLDKEPAAFLDERFRQLADGNEGQAQF